MNIFIRTNVAPYRVDTYNAIHKRLNAVMCFYEREGTAQKFDANFLESQCIFKPIYLEGKTFGSMNRKWCKGLWRMLRCEKPRVVIVPEFQISAIQVLMHRWLTHSKYKVVSMTDDSYDMIANKNDFTKLHAWLRNHLSKFFDDFIVVTPEVEQWYQHNFGKGIWMPIIMDEHRMLSYYEALLPKSRELAEKYDLSGKKVLLYVGRLVALKNLSRVIEAFGKTKGDVVLVIVGDGEERVRLESDSRKISKKVIFTGRFDGDELYAWYNLASVLILASYQEAFGAVANEALLAGCRVVISNKCGSSCLVDDNNGELIDPLDIRDIANAIDHQLSIATIPSLNDSRKSLMNISFEERVNNLINKLKV